MNDIDDVFTISNKDDMSREQKKENSYFGIIRVN